MAEGQLRYGAHSDYQGFTILLQDEDDEGVEGAEAVVVLDGADTCPELLVWVAENHPEVRPILLIEDRQSDPSVSHLDVTRCFPEHLTEVLA